jgi:hypothetical protein
VSVLHCTHFLFTHRGVVPPQATVHDPQWLGSEVSSAQTLPQAVRPLEQVWQMPPMQAAVETHWLVPVPEQEF